jgi:heme/copper-type cytochrome/quinol oxidase subunit 2
MSIEVFDEKPDILTEPEWKRKKRIKTIWIVSCIIILVLCILAICFRKKLKSNQEKKQY